jgi:hypothetical protein
VVQLVAKYSQGSALFHLTLLFLPFFESIHQRHLESVNDKKETLYAIRKTFGSGCQHSVNPNYIRIIQQQQQQKSIFMLPHFTSESDRPAQRAKSF